LPWSFNVAPTQFFLWCNEIATIAPYLNNLFVEIEVQYLVGAIVLLSAKSLEALDSISCLGNLVTKGNFRPVFEAVWWCAWLDSFQIWCGECGPWKCVVGLPNSWNNNVKWELFVAGTITQLHFFFVVQRLI